MKTVKECGAGLLLLIFLWVGSFVLIKKTKGGDYPLGGSKMVLIFVNATELKFSVLYYPLIFCDEMFTGDPVQFRQHGTIW